MKLHFFFLLISAQLTLHPHFSPPTSSLLQEKPNAWQDLFKGKKIEEFVGYHFFLTHPKIIKNLKETYQSIATQLKTEDASKTPLLVNISLKEKIQNEKFVSAYQKLNTPRFRFGSFIYQTYILEKNSTFISATQDFIEKTYQKHQSFLSPFISAHDLTKEIQEYLENLPFLLSDIYDFEETKIILYGCDKKYIIKSNTQQERNILDILFIIGDYKNLELSEKALKKDRTNFNSNLLQDHQPKNIIEENALSILGGNKQNKRKIILHPIPENTAIFAFDILNFAIKFTESSLSWKDLLGSLPSLSYTFVAFLTGLAVGHPPHEYLNKIIDFVNRRLTTKTQQTTFEKTWEEEKTALSSASNQEPKNSTSLFSPIIPSSGNNNDNKSSLPSSFSSSRPNPDPQNNTYDSSSFVESEESEASEEDSSQSKENILEDAWKKNKNQQNESQKGQPQEQRDFLADDFIEDFIKDTNKNLKTYTEHREEDVKKKLESQYNILIKNYRTFPKNHTEEINNLLRQLTPLFKNQPQAKL